MFLDRSRRADSRLEWKVGAFAVAAVLGIGGIYFEERWMTLSAILVLLGGLALRLKRRGRPSEDGGDHTDEDDEGEAGA